VNILRQLGIGAVKPTDRKRVVVVIDWPEHGGVRVRDAKDLVGPELQDLWGEVRRLCSRDLFRRGVIKRDGRKGTVRVAA
jgi:hypothetical protein